MAVTIAPDDFAHCLELLKSGAPDFYFADLLLPEQHKAAIIALHAFHVEVTNICLAGGEPMAGQVRLQWWSEVIQGIRADEASGHPVARALMQVIAEHNLPVSSFEAKLEAHIFDLYNDPMGNRSDFEAYCGETRSCLFQWASLVAGLPPERALADASGHSGVATGIVSVLENMARYHGNGQVFVPSDLLAATGLSRETFLVQPEAAHEAAITGLVDLGFEHEAKARQALQHLPQEARALFKPLALVPVYLKRVQRDPMAVFKPRPPLSQIRRQWALWRF
ncbi:MAG: phytoene/squalene synthase family protein [Rhizobiaceae bacterium]|nr:phytoene/squalene synthase family protein [Hyphomicrobiales bacterium]NRB32476.1 phytoene/squalene synthase family protein [Rhizobiaceae bacterium]